MPDLIFLARLLGVVLITAALVFLLVRKIRAWRLRNAIIEKIPGPSVFSALLGNIPFEIVGYIGSEFEQTKDFYYSK